MLGAEHADCVDVDPQALQATQDNARYNHISQQIATFAPGAIDDDQRYQLVLANILSGPLT